MGNKNSFCNVYPSAPSPLYYDLQSVVSDPVAQHIDFMSLYLGISLFIQVGGVSGGDKNLKEQALVAKEDDWFLQRKVFDGSKLGFPFDFVTSHVFRQHIQRGMITEEVRTEPGFILREVAALVIHQPSLRVECWRQTISDERGTGADATVELHSLLSAALDETAIECRPDQESKFLPGLLSVLTEDLTKKTTFDELWDSLLKVLRTQEHNDMKKFAEVKEDLQKSDEAETFHVACLVDAQIFMSRGGFAPQGMDRNLTYKVSARKELGAITLETVDEALYITYQVAYIVVHKEPLVIEYWRHMYGERRSGLLIREVLQYVLNTVIKAFKKSKKSGGDFFEAVIREVAEGHNDYSVPGAEAEATAEQEPAAEGEAPAEVAEAAGKSS